ncbi:SpaA isopeptide-forming pilin-related protein [Acidaminobacter sp.]|uniref:SpaA isopeptide-forming pilin-related protein n=1 Tax=Acidaminobacter sp. TaxID=1872102 RepID=UPI00255F04DE|nr:SdrD B-like domain-containing protein [Acidaminobacter sp.]MDK9712235.1 hypothetical protein [Acidaminobacter sp.]
MSEYHIVKSGLRRLMPLLLLVIMILAMMPIGSFAADETLYGYRVSYNNTQTQLADTRWMNSNLGNGWAEGDWVPYQLVLTGIDNLTDLPEVAVAYDFYGSQKDAVLVDLVRGFQVRWSLTDNANIALTDLQMGYPSSQTSPITTVDQMEAAQADPVIGKWDDFELVDVPKEQINLGHDGTNFIPLTPTSPVAHFRITDQQLKDAGVPENVKTLVIYFQLHLARTSLWQSGLFQHYGDMGVPAEEWGGHIYKEGTAFDGVSNFGSFYYPGSSGHAKLLGALRTVPIPIPSQNLGSVTGYKWHDMNGDGIKDANEPFLANWPIYITADIEGMSFVLSTLTDANGVYNFPTLTYGTRYITEGVTRGSETGWTQTFPTGEFDVTDPFGGFDNYNDYLNDIDEGSGVELADQGYMIVIDRNNFAFTNKNFGNRMTGDLEITKLFDYEDVEGFTDEMLPESIGIHVTGPSFDPDGADFDLLKDDDYYLLLQDLLPGDYSITEINVPEGWDAPDVPIDVSVIAGDVVEIDFTNVFLTGSLKITKEFDFEGIEGFDAETMLPNEITVEVTGPSYPTGTEVDITISDEGIGEVTLNNLIPGNYTVDELAFNGSEMWDSDIDPESVEVVGGALEAVVVSITNTFMPGELRITKDFDFAGIFGFDGATMLPDSITVEVTGPSYPAGTEVTINIDDLGDGTTLLQNLIPGDYTIEELAFTGSDAWDSDIDPEMVEVIAGANPVVEVMITNTFIPGELRITKVFDFEGIEGFNADTMLPASISVKVTGASYPLGTVVDIDIDEFGEGETLLDNLIPDDYTVEELTFEGSGAWDSAIVGSPATVVGGALTAVQVDITNTFEPGELKITKEFDFEDIVGFDPETMLPAEITVMVTGNSYPLGTEVDIPISDLGVGEVTIDNLIPGDYTVDELEFTGSEMWESLITGSPAAVVAGAETTVTVSITNTFIPGDLEITKFFDYEGVVGFVVEMLPESIDIHVTGPSYDPDGLDVTLYKADNYYVKLENLIPGDYSIDEILVGDEWEAPELPITEEVLADGLVSISFTNVYVPGDLEITKLFDYEGVVGFEDSMLPETIDIHIEGPSYDPDGLDVTLEKAEGYYVKLENLLPGTYEITEVNVPDDWMAPTLPIEVDVENGETASVEFTNVFMTGSLMITKNFVGGDETLWPEEIVVVVTGPSYLLGFEVVIEIDQVTGSGSVILDDLIPGEYSFSELAFPGSENFTSSISPQSVMVVAGAASPAIVTITNTMAYHDETAWAFGNNENWDSVKSKNWGWNIGPITDGYSETHDLIAGAGGNIVENGTLVGHVEIVYSGGYVTVTYHMLDGFELMDTHVWIGATNLPKMKNGKMTDSPGQFPYEDGASIAVTGPVYVAAHAVVRMPGN